jgi:hypothetical protein
MKSVILAGASALALLTAGAAFAADPSSTATIDQIGTSALAADANGANNNNSATIDQTYANADTGTLAKIVQRDQDNTATVTQSNSGNTASVTQMQNQFAGNGAGNIASVTQNGQQGSVSTYQDGVNFAQVQQNGGSYGEKSYVYQGGSQAYGSGGVEITQGGVNENAVAFQQGVNNSAFINQFGNGGGVGATAAESFDGVNNTTNNYLTTPSAIASYPGANNNGISTGALSIQNGVGNNSAISQYGYSSYAVNAASGNGNVQTANQFGGAYQASSDSQAFGNGNTSTVNQYAGTAVSATFQYGDANTATVAQNGSSTSLIGQGTVIENGAGLQTRPVGGSDDMAAVTQNNNGELSIINQEGSFETASVTQSGFGDTSKVYQTNGEATATVTQSGTNDYSHIYQSGDIYGGAYANTATVSQGQNDAKSFVGQVGYANTAVVKQ